MTFYIDDSIEKIAKTTLSSSKRAISFVLDYFYKLDPVNFKKTFTWPASSISPKKPYKNIFNLLPNRSHLPANYTIQPPRRFTDSSYNSFNYLLEESSQVAIKEQDFELKGLKGILRHNSKKGIYLDIDDNFVNLFYPLIKDKNKHSPSQAYITVISKHEYDTHEVDEIRELHETFSFSIKGLYSVYLDNDPTIEKVWFLEVESKDLEELRYKYHLSPKTGGHNFFIKAAIKPSYKASYSFPLMRINIAFLAA